MSVTAVIGVYVACVSITTIALIKKSNDGIRDGTDEERER